MNRRRFLQNSFVSLALLPLAGRTGYARSPLLPGNPKTFQGAEVLAAILTKANTEGWTRQPIGQLTGSVGLELRGIPYVGGTLELYEDREVCSANLLGLDCVTFYESALAIAQMIKAGEHSADDLLASIAHMRYRNGKVTDYASRLHYVSEWFTDNAAKGVVEVVSQSLPGAETYEKRIDFMSTHVDAYKQLKANPAMVTEIKAAEQRLNKQTRYYIPKAHIRKAQPQLKTGDIVGITTSIKGLDVSHTGLCYRDSEGVLRLLHASLTKKEVILDSELHTYIADNSKQTGIIVARPLEPTN